MVFFFKEKSIANIFILVVLCLAVHVHFFVTPPVVNTVGYKGFIGDVLTRFIQPLPPVVLTVLYYALVLLPAFRLNALLNNYRMFQKAADTTAMAYVLFSGIFVQWANITPGLVANLLLIWIFILLAKLYNHPSPKSLLFNTGLLSGVTILCYHPASILICITLFALAVVRPFRLAEWMVLLMGILLPFYFLFSWLFLTDQLDKFAYYTPDIEFHLPVDKVDAWFWTGLGVLVLSVLSGIYYWQQNNGRMVIQIRKTWSVMLLLLILMLPIPFMFKGTTMASAILSLIPIAAFASNVFLYPKRMLLPNLLFWAAAAVIAYNNWVLIKS